VTLVNGKDTSYLPDKDTKNVIQGKDAKLADLEDGKAGASVTVTTDDKTEVTTIEVTGGK
jgi:hypothetical protein